MKPAQQAIETNVMHVYSISSVNFYIKRTEKWFVILKFEVGFEVEQYGDQPQCHYCKRRECK